MNYSPTTLESHRAAQQRIPVSGGQLAYLDLGKGPPILLVHGVPTSSWLYRHMILLLIKKGFRVIAPDMLGYGSSDKPKGVDLYNPDQQGKRLIELMDHLNIKTWAHVLHDAGGIWTWELLRIAPKRVSHLIVLNTIAYEAGFKAPIKFKRGSIWGKFYASLYRSRMFCRFMINQTIQNGITKANCDLSKAERKGYWYPMSEGVSRALYTFFTSFHELYVQLPAYQEMFRKLEMPAMIIWGKQDTILIGEKQIPLLKKSLNIQETDIHLLASAAHFIQEEEPEKITDWIAEFVGRQHRNRATVKENL